MNPGNLKVYYVGFRETRGVQLVAICTGLLISVKSNYGCAKKKRNTSRNVDFSKNTEVKNNLKHLILSTFCR